jgi:hypothetical protein
MDFVEGLPRSQHADCILVIVDKFSKYGHFLPLSHPYTAHSVAHSFLFNVYKIHGLSSVIISDRDLVFTSQFWQQPFRLAGIELKPSSSYHPQTDGQTEQVNQCLETYLRCFANVCPTKWKEWLPVGEYWYNTSLHSALGRAPFEVLYGRQPRTFGLSVNHTMPSQLADWLQERSVMQELVHQHLLWAQARMKKQAYQHHSECSFAVGEWVYLKLQPYAQSSMMSRAHHKLSFKYFGPYQITSHVGAVVYHLQLPDHYRIHPVVHVSQLKLVAGFKGTASPTLPMSLPERVCQFVCYKLVACPRATVWCSKSWWNGLGFHLNLQHGRTRRRFVSAFHLHLLGDKQASKDRGVSPTKETWLSRGHHTSKMVRLWMGYSTQQSRTGRLVASVVLTGVCVGLSGCSVWLRPGGGYCFNPAYVLGEDYRETEL